jgi:hypothetical protein
VTEQPDRGPDDIESDRSLSEATPWGDDRTSHQRDPGEEVIGTRDVPDDDIEAATEFGDESNPKDTDAIPNV